MQTRIKGYTFTISEPFQSGTIITKGEAQALNDLRVENIANNLRKLVNDQVALLAPGAQLSETVLAELQAKFTEYDQNYRFLEKHVPRPRLGDIEEEARALARERAEEQARQAGQVLTEEELEALGAEMEKLPAIREEARERVAAKRRVLAEAIEDL